ncbi:hypothetical protein CJP74_00040 [Psittacicella melopsittaci]|uniref:Uncharacterized protein n=1 Tax=Psittacicella melopsittaci TaxID=2028576 RepID=A0A3A1Y7F5_9GAMM|nr:hypothetical protein [Psittacicella melopsittaci]RIY34213.1 hypothetical protein CJP74_00040 [Psittacicella melopsittaci]
MAKKKEKYSYTPIGLELLYDEVLEGEGKAELEQRGQDTEKETRARQAEVNSSQSQAQGGSQEQEKSCSNASSNSSQSAQEQEKACSSASLNSAKNLEEQTLAKQEIVEAQAEEANEFWQEMLTDIPQYTSQQLEEMFAYYQGYEGEMIPEYGELEPPPEWVEQELAVTPEDIAYYENYCQSVNFAQEELEAYWQGQEVGSSYFVAELEAGSEAELEFGREPELEFGCEPELESGRGSELGAGRGSELESGQGSELESVSAFKGDSDLASGSALREDCVESRHDLGADSGVRPVASPLDEQAQLKTKSTTPIWKKAQALVHEQIDKEQAREHIQARIQANNQVALTSLENLPEADKEKEWFEDLEQNIESMAQRYQDEQVSDLIAYLAQQPSKPPPASQTSYQTNVPLSPKERNILAWRQKKDQLYQHQLETSKRLQRRPLLNRIHALSNLSELMHMCGDPAILSHNFKLRSKYLLHLVQQGSFAPAKFMAQNKSLFLANMVKQLATWQQVAPHWQGQEDPAWQLFAQAQQVDFVDCDFTEVDLDLIASLYQKKNSNLWQEQAARLVLQWQLFEKFAALAKNKAQES